MDLKEQVLDKLIQSYRAKGLSVDRVLQDPLFKSLPVEDRIKAVMQFGHQIRAGQKVVDKKIVSDAVVGSVGSALAIEPFVNLFNAGLKTGWSEAAGTPPPSWAKEALGKKNVLGLARVAVGGSILAKEIGNVKRFYKVRNAIRSNVVEGQDISQDQAINVISATLR